MVTIRVYRWFPIGILFFIDVFPLPKQSHWQNRSFIDDFPLKHPFWLDFPLPYGFFRSTFPPFKWHLPHRPARNLMWRRCSAGRKPRLSLKRMDKPPPTTGGSIPISSLALTCTDVVRLGLWWNCWRLCLENGKWTLIDRWMDGWMDG